MHIYQFMFCGRADPDIGLSQTSSSACAGSATVRPIGWIMDYR